MLSPYLIRDSDPTCRVETNSNFLPMTYKIFEANKNSNCVPLDPFTAKWTLQRNAVGPPPKDFVPPGDRTPPEIFVTTVYATPKPELNHPTVPIDTTLHPTFPIDTTLYPNIISTIPYMAVDYTN